MADLAIEIQPPAAEPAKLRIYIGAAPGVGKTYRMLEQAHLLVKQGVDVVLGLIETHGRAETAALIHDIEIIPEKEQIFQTMYLQNEKPIKWEDSRSSLKVIMLNTFLDALKLTHLVAKVKNRLFGYLRFNRA